MKKFTVPFLIFVFALLSMALVSADSNTYTASPAGATNSRSYATAAQAAIGENMVFDQLVKKEIVSIGTAVFCCPNDKVSTYAASLAYMEGITPPCKVIITPTDLETASITYDIYSVNSSGEVVAPDTTALLPITNGKYEKVFFGMPNLVFGGSATGSMTVEIWKASY